MFNAIATTDTLEQFVNVASSLVDEARIHLRSNMLHLSAVDPANVAMVDQSLGRDAFESYDADGGVIGVNLTRFSDVLSMGDSGDLVHLELNEDTRTLEIDIEGLSYTLALIDPDAIRGDPDIPGLESSGEALMEGRALDRAITAADLVSDHVALGFDMGDGVFYGEASGDTDDVRFEIDSNELLPGSSFDADAQTLVSLDYMTDLLKPIDADTEVEVELGSEIPVKLHYQYAGGNGSVTNMVAPRIASD